MKKLIKNKLGMELSLNTVVVAIISIIVLILTILYFVNYYGGGSDQLTNVGQGALENVKNLN